MNPLLRDGTTDADTLGFIRTILLVIFIVGLLGTSGELFLVGHREKFWQFIPMLLIFVPIDLNSARDEAILSIPGVGRRMLCEFKEYCPYQRMDQFRREIGNYVNDEEVARLERYVT